jgi:hypothetical protein
MQVKLPIPVISLHWIHQTLLRIFSRISPGIESQILLALGVNGVFSIFRVNVAEKELV